MQDLCSANIKLNEYTVIHRPPEDPMSYAEIEYLRFVLGEDAITDIVVVRSDEATNTEVLETLRLKFGPSKFAEAFPGTKPRLPLEAPNDVPRMTAARPAKGKAKPAPEPVAEPESPFEDNT
jgi:hypothetical protein